MMRKIFFVSLAGLFLFSAVIFSAGETVSLEAAGTAKAVIAVK